MFNFTEVLLITDTKYSLTHFNNCFNLWVGRMDGWQPRSEQNAGQEKCRKTKKAWVNIL